VSDDRTRRRSERKRTISENQQLRRENSRLRKQLQRLNAAVNSMTYNGFTLEEVEEQIKKEPPSPKGDTACPKCGNPTGEVELGKFKYLFCSSCSHRERK
jgi:hypothetical protein